MPLTMLADLKAILQLVCTLPLLCIHHFLLLCNNVSHATLQTLLTTLVAMLVLHSSLCSGLFLAPLSLSLSPIPLLCPFPFPAPVVPPSEVEQKLAEERAAKMRVENRMLELEKHSSMLDCDYKQSLQKLDELRRHKDRDRKSTRLNSSH